MSEQLIDARNNLVEAYKKIYPVVLLKEYSVDNCKEVLSKFASVIENIYDDHGGNAHFVDSEILSYYYDLSKLDFNNSSEISIHLAKKPLAKIRCDSNTIENIVNSLKSRGKNVTHVTISDEKYGGDDSSVWRDYEKATLYEIVDFNDLLERQKANLTLQNNSDNGGK